MCKRARARERERAREQRPLLNVAAVIGQKSKNNPRLLFLQQQLGLSFECLQFIAAATRWREREREKGSEKERERYSLQATLLKEE